MIIYGKSGKERVKMILESIWFYIIILALGVVWIYLTE